jgi:hypothetical protein
MNAMDHLGNVLSMLADLHPDYQCRAFTEALSFYNAARPDARVEPHEGWETRLVNIGPLDRALQVSGLE